ncbi:MAG: hypothetical protein ACOC2L_00585 [Candidatus Sumerlaeota bacterium]
MKIEDKIALHKQWWEKTNERPLVHIFPPSPAVKTSGEKKKSGVFDVDISPDEMIARKCKSICGKDYAWSDNLPVANVNFGPAFLPGLAGAAFEHDGNTVWTHPCAESAEDLHIGPLDPGNPVWRNYIGKFKRLLADWREHDYLPGPANIVGPMDCVAAMLGPENLSMELMLHPEAVQRAAMDAAKLFMEVLTIETQMLREAGLQGGVVDWMHTWLPGVGRCYSEDYSALCGEDLFREFFLEPNAWIAERIDTPYLHIHSGAYLCMPAILEIPGLKAVELSNDPNGPDLDKYLATARMIQEAGLSLQVSNWERPLERRAIEKILNTLDPRGLKVTLQATRTGEAEQLYGLVTVVRVET